MNEKRIEIKSLMIVFCRLFIQQILSQKRKEKVISVEIPIEGACILDKNSNYHYNIR